MALELAFRIVIASMALGCALLFSLGIADCVISLTKEFKKHEPKIIGYMFASFLGFLLGVWLGPALTEGITATIIRNIELKEEPANG